MKRTYILVSVLILFSAFIVLTTSVDQPQPNEPKIGAIEMEESKKDRPDLYQEYHNLIRQPVEPGLQQYDHNYRIQEWKKAVLKLPKNRSVANLDWIERGPGNVGGRTRSILVDPADPTHRTCLLDLLGEGFGVRQMVAHPGLI